jgi:hypothetical protein
MVRFGVRFGIGLRFVLSALGGVVGCGGSAVIVGDGGGVASCADNCSAAQVADSCASLCDKVTRASCPGTTVDPTCAMQCTNIPSMTPACEGVLIAFLRCTGPAQPTCTGSGSVFPGCVAQEQALNDCFVDAGGPRGVVAPPSEGGPGSLPGSSGSACAPANVCPTIPRPTGAGTCSGGGGGGPNGPVTQTTCQDSAGNVWQASCVGSTCTCSYNGGSACMCTTSGPACASCCPGAS